MTILSESERIWKEDGGTITLRRWEEYQTACEGVCERKHTFGFAGHGCIIDVELPEADRKVRLVLRRDGSVALGVKDRVSDTEIADIRLSGPERTGHEDL